MDQVKAALNEATAEARQHSAKHLSLLQKLSMGVEKVVNNIPWLGAGSYEHPPVDYGANYAAYLPTSPRGRARSGVNPLLPKI